MNDPIIGAGQAPAASPASDYLLRWEQARFDAAVADVFGYYALQVGLPGLDCLRANRISCRVEARLPWAEGSDGPAPVSIQPGGQMQQQAPAQPQAPVQPQASVQPQAPLRRAVVRVERPEELPFATQSLDLVALPHVLESSSDPHEVLREAERVLRPEGRLVVSGLNPISLWGARQLLPGGLPWALPRPQHLIAQPRLRDWLKLLGFEPDRAQYGCYRPYCRTSPWLERTAFLERPGDRWWPICGAVYMLSAVKRVRAMRLVGPAWKKPAAARAAAPAAVASTRAGAVPPVGGSSARVSGTCTRETAAAD